jgi:glutathione S-transferase
MKLFWTPASPFTRKVSVCAKVLGLWEQMEIVPTAWPLSWGYQTVSFTEGLAEANPVARIPTLITDRGVPLGDSTLICLHLDSMARDASVIPEGEAAWPMWSLYAIADGLIEAQIAMRAEQLRPEQQRSESFLQKQRDRIVRCFDALAARVDELECADDDSPDLAMITAGIACGYQDWRAWLDDFRPGRPALSRWADAFSQRPAMVETMPAETPEA